MLLDQSIKKSFHLHLALVVDTTGSMSSHISQVRNRLDEIFDRLNASADSYRVALVTYNDAPPQGLYDARVDQAFTEDIEDVREALNSLRVSGGGDWEETVFSGIYKALVELEWRPGVVKVMLVIGTSNSSLEYV